MSRQIDWAYHYDGYRRLAHSPETLLNLIAEARRETRSTGKVPEWCGVDFLRGWAFYLTREDRHGGGYGLTDPASIEHVEWSAVLTRLAHHPDARSEERPPMPQPSPPASAGFSTVPRTHRDANVLAAKRARLWEPHVAPVNHLVDEIADSGKGDVPYIDPDSGGVHARVMFLLEAPARAAAHGSGMLSADNDDSSAQHVWEAYAAAGLPRNWGIHWNTVPWYVGTREKIQAVTKLEVSEGLQWTARLLDLVPDLRVLVAMGVPAKSAAKHLAADLSSRGVQVLGTWHPSQRNYNSRPQARPDVARAFREARVIAERVQR